MAYNDLLDLDAEGHHDLLDLDQPSSNIRLEPPQTDLLALDLTGPTDKSNNDVVLTPVPVAADLITDQDHLNTIEQPKESESSALEVITTENEAQKYTLPKSPPVSIFHHISQYCDVKTLGSLLLVSQEAYHAVISNDLWLPILELLGIPQGQSITEDPKYALQTPMEYSEQTFNQIYLILSPIIEDHSLIPETLEDRARVLSNAYRFFSVTGIYDTQKLEFLITSLESELIKSISESSDTGVPPDPAVFAACDILFANGHETFAKSAIETHYTGIIPQFNVNSVFVRVDVISDDDVGTQVSEDKLRMVFTTVSEALTRVSSDVNDARSVLPPQWKARVWNTMATYFLDRLNVFGNEVLIAATNLGENEYLATVPRFYSAAQVLNADIETGKLYGFDIKAKLNEILDPILNDFSERQIRYVDSFAQGKVETWNLTIAERETETEKFLWSSVPKKSDKYSFISSFKWAFQSNSSNDNNSGNENSNSEPKTEFEAQTAVLVSKLRGMESLVSIELVIEILNVCRTANQRLYKVERASPKALEHIFCTFVTVIGRQYLRPAFQKALSVLNSYDPKKFGRLMASVEGEEVAVEPLLVFTELVNVGDLVQQMCHVYFEEELVATRVVRQSDFGAPSVNSKRKFEQMLDDMLAEGLSRGIDVLIDQIEFTLHTEQLGSDFLPLKEGPEPSLAPTPAAEKVISIVGAHLALLKETTEKMLYEVFQHEVGFRLYMALSKHIKSQIISEEGAIKLIADVNAYHKFILGLRQASLYPYYEALKQIAQLFLIDRSDAKQIAFAMGDSSRYNGVVTTEDLLEFVKRRRDWPLIRRKVEKSLYGVFECLLM